MKAKRILWGEGMFLRPQHFQQLSHYQEQQLAHLHHTTKRNGWGMRLFNLDRDALKGGLIRIDALSVLFRDGTLVTAPEHDPLPLSRNLNEIPQCGIQTTLYACLPEVHAHGGNVSKQGETASRPARFSQSSRPFPDLYTGALDADIALLDVDIHLMIEEENRDGYDSIPLARLAKDATGQWSVSNQFTPPMTDITASAELTQMLRRLLDILLVKNKSLAGVHRERAKNVMEYSSTDIGSFWLLHTINRNFARLNHLARCSPLHPEELYLNLAEFCGELQTFSTIYTLEDIPSYRHEALHEVLPILDKQIRELLETVISARYAILPLHSPKPSFHIAAIESDRLLENVDYYLSVQSDLPAAQIIENVPLKIKIGAPDDVEKLLNSAMRGVSVSHAAQTPSAIPVRVGNHYFALEPQGDIYQRMLQSRSICIYVPQTLADVRLELIAVFR